MLLLFTATLWKKKPGLDAVQCFPQHGSKAKHCSFISLISKAGFFIYLFIFFPLKNIWYCPRNEIRSFLSDKRLEQLPAVGEHSSSHSSCASPRTMPALPAPGSVPFASQRGISGPSCASISPGSASFCFQKASLQLNAGSGLGGWMGDGSGDLFFPPYSRS